MAGDGCGGSLLSPPLASPLVLPSIALLVFGTIIAVLVVVDLHHEMSAKLLDVR